MSFRPLDESAMTHHHEKTMAARSAMPELKLAHPYSRPRQSALKVALARRGWPLQLKTRGVHRERGLGWMIKVAMDLGAVSAESVEIAATTPPPVIGASKYQMHCCIVYNEGVISACTTNVK